jgi:hypothetical protein
MNLANQLEQVELDKSIEDIDFNVTLKFCFEVDEINNTLHEALTEADKPTRNITMSEYSNLVKELSRYIQEQMSDMYDRDLHGDGYVDTFIREHLSELIK